MKTTSLNPLTSTAILMLASICHAQQIDESSSGSVADNKPIIMNRATPKGDRGDVEQSGAELGLGSGPNYVSGLAPRGIGTTVNGKGAPPMGGTAR